MLVFDVGANVGEYTDYYRRLGCRVVAIEPNPPLAALIRARMPDVPVVEAALGVADGQAELHIGPGTGDSTLSDRYAAIVEERTGVASRPVTVRVTTISRLASKFGFPDYIKIDVEGAERDVLAGRGDVEPPIVSFEVHGSLVDEADACLALLPDRTFSLMIGEDFAWSLEVASREQVIAALRELSAADSEVYGDVFCFRSVANSGSVS
jgi:FkbM family methyltransferase